MYNPFRLLRSSVKEISKPETPISFYVTLWPDFTHYTRFARDTRLQGIRLNSAMVEAAEINRDFERGIRFAKVPTWFDVKGMQMRIREVMRFPDHVEFILNRPVKVKTPCLVWFKAGEDAAMCTKIINGTHFIFETGPQYDLKVGESIHIRDANMEVGGPTFLDYEVEKIEKIKALGMKNWCLSYVYEEKHVSDFLDLVGPDANVKLKIENVAGLNYVANKFRKIGKRVTLFCARGDLYIEVPRPHDIIAAAKLIIEKDPDALVGSRMLLSLVHYDAPKDDNHKPPTMSSGQVPSCSDLFELYGLYNMGYRNFMLCDELCLKEEWLSVACNVFDAFRKAVQS